MPFLILFVVVLFLFLVSRFAGAGRTKLLKSGLLARGLVLSASPTSTRVLVNGQSMEQRSVHLDIEIPGQPPYEASIVASFPRLCEAFPGAALDLRVDPGNPKNIAIVGPAGASGWIDATRGLFPWSPRLASGFGAGSVVMIVILTILGLGAVESLTANRRTSDVTPEEPTPARTVPVPHITPTVEAPASLGFCDAAVRCCKTLGRSECTRYSRASDAVCRAALQEEKRAAAHLRKTCE